MAEKQTMKAPVFQADGARAGERELPASLFDGQINEPVMWQAVKAYLANQRQGTASAKGRSEVSGGNKKPWRQKGTGRARHGSIRSPQWRGGGNVFGPRPGRNYRQELPRQVRRAARHSAYNVRAVDGGILLVEALPFEQPRTRQLVELLESLDAQGNVLILTNGHSPHVYLSARNLAGVQVRRFGDESTYDVLWADTLVMEVAALENVAEAAHA